MAWVSCRWRTSFFAIGSISATASGCSRPPDYPADKGPVIDDAIMLEVDGAASGEGWFCYRADGEFGKHGQCLRTTKECEDKRTEVVRVFPKDEVSPCAPHPAAACFTSGAGSDCSQAIYKDRATRGRTCFYSREVCDHHRARGDCSVCAARK